jgi:hypothetical protein
MGRRAKRLSGESKDSRRAENAMEGPRQRLKVYDEGVVMKSTDAQRRRYETQKSKSFDTSPRLTAEEKRARELERRREEEEYQRKFAAATQRKRLGSSLSKDTGIRLIGVEFESDDEDRRRDEERREKKRFEEERRREEMRWMDEERRMEENRKEEERREEERRMEEDRREDERRRNEEYERNREDDRRSCW